MAMELDVYDAQTWIITGIFYLFCMAILWKFMFIDASYNAFWNLKTKIIISVLAVPILFLITSINLNK